MKPFLSEVIDHLLKHHHDQLGDCVVVFPNRRAGLFLKKLLSQRINKPIWAPKILSLEDFLFQYALINKADTLTLIFELFEAFNKHRKVKESFEKFYSWGEVLLKDFEEVDHYLINPDQLFKHIENNRQLAEDFYFLNTEQEKIIQKFWQGFFPTASKSQEQFMETWKILAAVYKDFKKALISKGIGYTSHIYRHLYDNPNFEDFDCPIVFAGFNALTLVEEELIKHFIREHNATILWDVDDYYLKDTAQEAGLFLRRYQKDILLGKNFASRSSTLTAPKPVSVTGVSLEVGQAKLIGERIQKLLTESDIKQEEIVVVLPQDYMLFPVLNAIPKEVTELNVTMGYPLKETPLFGLLASALEAQESKTLTPENWLSFYHKHVLDILIHPYMYEVHKEKSDKVIHFIKTNNQIRVVQQDLQKAGSELINSIFRSLTEGETYAAYLQNIVRLLGEVVVVRFGLEKEFLYQFNLLLCRLDEILQAQEVEVELKIFKGLFRSACRSIKIPFSGEPVKGLQIMGVLETRNLDFKHIFMLNMNEDIYPSSQRNTSFIPFNIRKAFSLPTFMTQDAIYAYLFYRLFQRSQSLEFFYNMHAEYGLSGEISRFLRQITLESGLSIEHTKLSNPIQVKQEHKIVIEKTPDILKKLERYTDKGNSKLSPSAINTYLDCRLRFYFKYVLRLFPNDELNDELTPGDFGNILHKVMEIIYEEVTKNKTNRLITENDFFGLDSAVAGAIEQSFRQHFRLKNKQKFEVKGRNVVMVEIMKKFVEQILTLDKAYAPFEIVSLENDKDGNYDHALKITPDSTTYSIRLKGIIDRVDSKDGNVRVIDYKSGKDNTEVGSVERCFERNHTKRNKVGLQTLYYTWLYVAKRGKAASIIPSIMTIQELFTPHFDVRLKMNGEPIMDAQTYLMEFEERFKALLSEIYGMEQPFDQTEDIKKCTYCDFRSICGR